jgi:hypothetical protein
MLVSAISSGRPYFFVTRDDVAHLLSAPSPISAEPRLCEPQAFSSASARLVSPFATDSVRFAVVEAGRFCPSVFVANGL